MRDDAADLLMAGVWVQGVHASIAGEREDGMLDQVLHEADEGFLGGFKECSELEGFFLTEHVRERGNDASKVAVEASDDVA